MVMRASLTACLVLVATGCAQTPAQRLATERASAAAKAQLDQDLAGLTRGRASDCLPPYRNTQVKAYGPTIVYTVSRGLKYRSDTAGGCERVGRGDVLITRTTTGQLCQGDIATTVEPASRTFSGSCSFGPFIRYEKGS